MQAFHVGALMQNVTGHLPSRDCCYRTTSPSLLILTSDGVISTDIVGPHEILTDDSVMTIRGPCSPLAVSMTTASPFPPPRTSLCIPVDCRTTGNEVSEVPEASAWLSSPSFHQQPDHTG